MKKLIALLLLTMLLFNLSGYLLTEYAMQQNEHRLVASLDLHAYSDKNLVLIKIPLHLPYTTDNHKFVRVNGQVKVGQTYYNYVKRRICQDTLMLMCIPNPEKARLVGVSTQLSAQAENTAPVKSALPILKKAAPADDFIAGNPMLLSSTFSCLELSGHIARSALPFSGPVQEPAAEPPEA